MAERRMFAKTIIDSDAFLDMPLSAQALYFHLSMRADDDGFVNNPKRIQRTIGGSDDDYKILLAKNFIISFDSGVIVIKHWKIHNYIRGDRKKDTAYPDEMGMLTVKENGAYTLCLSDDSQMSGECQANVSVGKDSIGKNSIEESNKLSGKPDTESQEEFGNDIKTVLEYLNEKAGKNFKLTTESNKKFIRARMKEGFKVEDFKKVVDVKCKEWLGREQAQYLRPETLFSAKHFESYLNQNETMQQGQKMTEQQKNINAMKEYIKELEANGE